MVVKGHFSTHGFVKKKKQVDLGLQWAFANQCFLDHSVGCSFSKSLQVDQFSIEHNKHTLRLYN